MLHNGDGIASGGSNETLVSIENVSGTPNDDILHVDFPNVASHVRGRDGLDTINTQDGDNLDVMNGSGGFDICNGDAGDTALNC